MKKLLVVLMAFFLATAVSGGIVPKAQHFVNGTEIFEGDEVSTKNSFEYKVVLANNSEVEKIYFLEETISNKLTLVSSNYTFSTVGMSEYNTFVFNQITIPGYSTVEIKMNFQNNSGEDEETASINTSYCNGIISCNEDFQFFVFKANVPAIPEFFSPLIPLLGVLGSAFIFIRK